MTDQQPTRRAKALGEAFARAAAKDSCAHAAGQAVARAAASHLQIPSQNRAGIAAALAQAVGQANLPDMAQASRTLGRMVEQMMTLQAPARQILEQVAAAVNTDAISAALREFNGADWSGLGASLSTTAWVVPATGTTTIPTPTITNTDDTGMTDTMCVELVGETAWRSNPRLAYLTLAAVLSVSLLVSTYGVLGAEAWHELRDDTAWLLAVYGAALVATQRMNRR